MELRTATSSTRTATRRPTSTSDHTEARVRHRAPDLFVLGDPGLLRATSGTGATGHAAHAAHRRHHRFFGTRPGPADGGHPADLLAFLGRLLGSRQLAALPVAAGPARLRAVGIGQRLE